MNKKAKPHKRSLIVGDQNGILVLGLCHFVYEEFGYNDLTLVALYYGKIEYVVKLSLMRISKFLCQAYAIEKIFMKGTPS